MMRTNKIVITLVVIVLFNSLPACSITDSGGDATEITQAPGGEQPTLSPVDMAAIAGAYPPVDGSTSTHPLQILVACNILQVTCEWTLPLFSERTILPGITKASPKSLEIIDTIWHTGTHSSYVNLINGDADLILAARRPSVDEIQLANQEHVQLDIRAVALDAFVFLAHRDNPVTSLTLDQVRAIYSGEVTDWSGVGVEMGPINAYQRNPNSGSQELMDEMVMQSRAMIDAPDMILETMMGPINAISEDVAGIGYSVFYYATFMLPNENIKLLGIDGIIPTSTTIANQTYPLVSEVYVVIRSNMDSTDPAVLLRDWLLTEAGQVVVGESGYIPIRPYTQYPLSHFH